MSPNSGQKKVLLIGLFCLGFLVVILPWKTPNGGAIGYAPIFLPPYVFAEVDVQRLSITIGFVVLATAILLVVCHKKPDPPNPSA